MFNVNKMMKQFQQMQADMLKAQEELAGKMVEATAGGGVVRVVFNGRQELQGIEIEKEAVDPDDLGMLQDLIIAAVNEGLRQSQALAAGEMAKITGGLNIPNLPGMPF